MAKLERSVTSMTLIQEFAADISKAKSNKIYKFLLAMFGCFWVTILVSYFLYLQGNTYFLLSIQGHSPKWQINTICWVMTSLEYGICFSAITGRLNKDTFKLTAIYSLINILVVHLFPFSIIQTLIAPYIFVFLYIIINYKSLKSFLFSAIRCIVFTVAIALYQYFTIPVKFDILNFNYLSDLILHDNIISVLFKNLDIVCIMFLGAAIIGGDLVGRLGTVFSLDSESKSDAPAHDAETEELITAYQNLGIWLKIRGIIIMVAIQTLQTLVIALACTANNRLIELCIIAPVFWISRTIFNKSYHSDSIFICTGISCVLFYSISALAIPFKYSMFSCIIWAGLLGYGMYLAAIHFEDYQQLSSEKQERDAFNNKSRRHRAETALQNIAPDTENYRLLYDYVHGETLEILADKYNMSQSTLNRRINALTRK